MPRTEEFLGALSDVDQRLGTLVRLLGALLSRVNFLANIIDLPTETSGLKEGRVRDARNAKTNL